MVCDPGNHHFIPVKVKTSTRSWSLIFGYNRKDAQLLITVCQKCGLRGPYIYTTQKPNLNEEEDAN